MNKLLARSSLAGLLILGAAHLAAQDLAIVNTRVIVGNGTVIEAGTLIMRSGKIASVSAGAANTQGLKTIDAKGMSAMPGFIDAHRHINTGPNEKVQMQQLIEAGYTTVLSGGGPAEGNLTLRDHIEKGVINGPRIIPTGTVRLTLSPEEARALRQRIGNAQGDLGRIKESRRPGAGTCREPPGHDGRGRCRRAPAGSYPAFRMAEF